MVLDKVPVTVAAGTPSRGDREGRKVDENAYQTSMARTIWNKSSGLPQLRLAPTPVNNKGKNTYRIV